MGTQECGISDWDMPLTLYKGTYGNFQHYGRYLQAPWGRKEGEVACAGTLKNLLTMKAQVTREALIVTT